MLKEERKTDIKEINGRDGKHVKERGLVTWEK